MNLKHFFANVVASFLKPHLSESFDIKNINKILIVRQHDQLGDMICAIPLIRTLRNSYPEAYMCLIASPVNAIIMQNHPYLNEVLCYDKKKYWTNPAMLIKFIREIRKHKFDLAVISATVSLSTTSDLIALISGAKIRLGPSSLNGKLNPCAKYFTHQVDLSWDYDQHRHQTLRNLDILKPLGLLGNDLSVVIGFSDLEEKYAREISNTLRGGKPYLIGIHPGAGKPANRWKAEYFADVANKLHKEFNASVVVTVGPMDDEPYSILRSHMQCPYEVIYKKPLREVAALLNNFDLFITNDTGIMHVAAATGTNVLALFGNTDPLQWAPKNQNLCYISINNGNINSITVEEVWKEIIAILSKKV